MTLKAIVDDLDAVPEALREHYEEANDGGFRLKVEPARGWSLDNVDGLKSALSSERAEVKRLKETVEQFGDMDPKKARDAVSRLEKLAAEDPESKAAEQIEAIKRQMQEKLSAREQELSGVADRYRKQLERELIEARAAAAIAKNKGNVDLLLPHVQKMMRVDEEGEAFVARVVDDKGEVRLTKKASSTDPMNVDELVESMRNDERYSAAFAGTGATGGGATSSRGGSNAGGTNLTKLSPDARLAHLLGGG